MTAAIVALAILAASLGAGLLATVYALNAKTKEVARVERAHDQLAISNSSLAAGAIESADKISKRDAVILNLNAQLAAAQAQQVRDMSNAALVDTLNGVLPNPDRSSASPGADEERAVPDKPRAGAVGAHGDDLQ